MSKQQNAPDSPAHGQQSHEKHKISRDDPRSEEPDITQEESVPLDGKDTEGEELMKSVRNDLLEDPAPKADADADADADMT